MFSHECKIRVLYEIYSEGLGFNLTQEKVLKAVHAAFLTEDDGLFMQGIEFIRKMLRSHSVNDIQEWIYYHVKHPECAARIYEAIQFHSLQETPISDIEKYPYCIPNHCCCEEVCTDAKKMYQAFCPLI